jgi:hypothetical protein
MQDSQSRYFESASPTAPQHPRKLLLTNTQVPKQQQSMPDRSPSQDSLDDFDITEDQKAELKRKSLPNSRPSKCVVESTVDANPPPSKKRAVEDIIDLSNDDDVADCTNTYAIDVEPLTIPPISNHIPNLNPNPTTTETNDITDTTEKEEPVTEQPTTTVEEEAAVDSSQSSSSTFNPFSQFSFLSNNGNTAAATTNTSAATNAATTATTATTKKKRSQPPSNKQTKAAKHKTTAAPFIPVRSLPLSDQERVAAKWQSLCDPATTSLETRRFHLLIAARLHAQTQEPTVRHAMRALFARFPGEALTPSTVASLAPDELTAIFPFVHFATSKASQLVTASKEILQRHKGVVPGTLASLKGITGIGPKFADLLEFVNCKEAHEKNMKERAAEAASASAAGATTASKTTATTAIITTTATTTAKIEADAAAAVPPVQEQM